MMTSLKMPSIIFAEIHHLKKRLAGYSLQEQEQQEILSSLSRLYGKALIVKLSLLWGEDKSNVGDNNNDEIITWHTIKQVQEIIHAGTNHNNQLLLLEELNDLCLDHAIAAKEAGDLQNCVMSHLLRMTIDPSLIITDAVRLLGYNNDDVKKVQQYPDQIGLFETTKEQGSFFPSQHALDLGRAVQNLFRTANYTNRQCRLHLASSNHPSRNNQRLYDANYFFRHRWQLENNNITCALDVFIRLFLYGIAVRATTIEQHVGKDSLNLLQSCGLLFQHPLTTATRDNCYFVGQVQIYPISPDDFMEQQQDAETRAANDCCWFMTDWPLQSLRASSHAVMPVGYDTLELMSLAVGVVGERLLDLCCGCGIQGIFAYRASKKENTVLVCTDVNVRALRLCAANFALNGIHQGQIRQGDLFQALDQNTGTTKLFDVILCNPPFVPLLSKQHLHQPELYAVAGTMGTSILERIFGHVHHYLTMEDGRLFMVTELPNIQDSCELIHSWGKHNDGEVAVAYVVQDVEHVTDYGKVRAQEHDNDDDNDELEAWCQEQSKAGIRDRALALIAMKYTGRSRSMLYPFSSEKATPDNDGDGEDPQDEEDAFLTIEGMQFCRSKLLF